MSGRTATSVTLRVSVAATAALGSRDLTLTNNDGGRSVCAGCLSVVDAPRITTVSPATVRRSTTTTVTLTGTSFDPSMAVTIAGGGVTIVSVDLRVTDLGDVVGQGRCERCARGTVDDRHQCHHQGHEHVGQRTQRGDVTL